MVLVSNLKIKIYFFEVPKDKEIGELSPIGKWCI
jgi:hypothetical protein